jgi:cytosine/adenosine deaminase-related metal-dependent hydrolase
VRCTVRAALRADGTVVAPARWTVVAGRTLALEPARGEPALDAVLLPALVNAHAHLDLAGAQPLPATGSFTDWLMGVGRTRGEARDIARAAQDEAAALRRRGVVAVGDVDASAGRAAQGRIAADVGGRSYLEIVGVAAPSARARLAEMLALADRMGGASAGLGISPHAPYSVNAEVLPEIARAARRRGLPLAMHLAETEDETRYLLHGDGPFVELLRAIGRGVPFETPPRLRPIAYADAAGLLEAGCVVVHGNDLDDEDVARLAARSCSVVYCHGTHRHFARPPHRLPALLAAGVNVALGTDSGLSNAGVDLLAEAGRLLADRPDVDPLHVLRCATLGGRIALGLPTAPALLQPGSDADALLLGAAPPDAETLAPRALASWAFSPSARVVATVRAGRAVSGEAAIPGFLDTAEGAD